MAENMKSGFYPGSFDPLTNGHIDILERCFQLVDRLVVGIGASAGKTPLFSIEERHAMLTEELSPRAKKANCAIEIITFDGLLVDAAKELNVQLIIRGLRNGADFDYEAQMIAMNRIMSPEIEVICLAAGPDTGFISSTLVRQIARMKGDVTPFLPASVAKKLIEKMPK